MTSDAGSAVPQHGPIPLRLRDFEGRVGSPFDIAFQGEVQELVLTAARELPDSPREEGGFRLEFCGPPEPRLPQAIYAFEIDGVSHDIFVVPTGFAIDGLLYEAVFF